MYRLIKAFLFSFRYVLPSCKIVKDFIRKQTYLYQFVRGRIIFPIKTKRVMLRLGLLRKHLIKSLDNIFYT